MKTNRIMRLHPNKEEKAYLDDLMRVFSSMKRYAFNRLIEGKSVAYLNKIMPAMFNVNKRYAEDAVLLAQSIIKSQHELLPQRIEDIKVKLQKTERKIHDYETGKKKPKKVDLKTCLIGLCMRKDKLQANLFELESHQESGTIPTVIFGGRKNFVKRMKGDITNEEWKDLRTNELYARGDKSKKGNLNIRIVFRDGTYCLDICNPLLKEEGKRNAPRFQVETSIPDKYFEEITNIVMPDEMGVYQPYTLQIKRKDRAYYAHFIYDEEVCGREIYYQEDITNGVVAGIDINIDRIAVSLATKQGNFLESKVFYCHELEYVRSNKRNNIVGETVKRVFEWLLSKNIGAIIVENITLKQQHDTDHKFNRLTSNFKKKKLSETIIRRGLRYGFLIKKVNPAYTSVIGRFKYSSQCGISVHEAASFVIARRGLGYEEKIPKELIHVLKKKVKPHLIAKLGSMEETEKQSEQGKKQRKYLGMLLNKINTFKKIHLWSLWNVVHKTLWLDQQQIKLREV